jgi:prevent-host-death family protein
MRSIKLSEDVVPVSEFKAQASEWLKRLRETHQPLVITQNGKVAGVILSPAEYDRLMYHARFVAAVEEGLADADAGRTTPHEEVLKEIEARASRRKRAR